MHGGNQPPKSPHPRKYASAIEDTTVSEEDASLRTFVFDL